MARLAILEDNDRLLRRRLEDLRARLPSLIEARCCAAMVIGSVARGEAGDRSDLDVLVVLREGLPRRSDYDWWERAVAPGLGALASAPFPVEPLIVGRPALTTTEPNLRDALASGIRLWDPEGVFDDQPAARP